MDDLPLVERIVRTCAEGLDVPVTCKIRVFPELQKTIAYAQMLERAGASLIAVHGRLREQKKSKGADANWDVIKASLGAEVFELAPSRSCFLVLPLMLILVGWTDLILSCFQPTMEFSSLLSIKAALLQAVREAVSVPVLANGNIRTLHDVHQCMEYTGCVGVMSAESLLEDPALFSPARLTPEGQFRGTAGAQLLLEYLDLAEEHPTPMRMVTGHAFKMLGESVGKP